MAAKPFNQQISLHLDALIIALESSPRWPRRTLLKVQKRLAERAVPGFCKQVAQ